MTIETEESQESIVFCNGSETENVSLTAYVLGIMYQHAINIQAFISVCVVKFLALCVVTKLLCPFRSHGNCAAKTTTQVD